jgi:predicted component of type VI protein secretion system
MMPIHELINKYERILKQKEKKPAQETLAEWAARLSIVANYQEILDDLKKLQENTE